MSKNSQITTRFAPSPTGFLHVGGLRTALFNYLWARQNKGTFILRIEDTDQARLVDGAEDQLREVLELFGLQHDKFFRQSDRLEKYREVARRLIETGHAYEHTPTEGERKGLTAVYFKVPKGEEITFNDVVRGTVKVASDEVEDFVILKADGWPTYHLASVVDDNEMEVTHVIRGEEWLPSLPKHVLLYKALEYEMPEFVHLPLLLNPDKSKLSKRQGDVAVEDFLAKGYLPEALLNYVALLGWNPGDDREVFSLDELVTEFSLTKINKAGAIFDQEKLKWFNAHYIREAVTEHGERYAYLLHKITTEVLPDHDPAIVEKLFTITAPRLEYLEVLKDHAEYIFGRPDIDPEMLVFKKSSHEATVAGLTAAHKVLAQYSGSWEIVDLDQLLKGVVEKESLTPGDVFWPVRVALSGREASPSPVELAWVLGHEETIERLKYALKKL